jgi:ATP-binding cassette subfamily B protein
VRFYLMMSTGERVVTDLRRAVFDHILALPPAYYERTQTGEIVSRLTNDVTMIESVIGSGISMLIRNVLMMIGAAAMLVVTSPKLAALILVGVPATLVPILILGRRVRGLARASQDRVAEVSAYADEAVHEIRTVQAYGHQGEDARRFGERAERAFGAQVARIRYRAFLFASVMLIAFCAIGVILWIGGHDVLAGRTTAGQLSAFVFYAFIVASGAGAISEVWGDVQRANGATERLMELLEVEPAIASPRDPLPLPSPARGEVRFEHLTFHYPTRQDTAALADFSLTVGAGERVALVGPSGAGKSTVFQLLLRFYDPESGAVLVDGIDARRADLNALRRRFALVPQEPVIFSGSVADNVRYGRPDASEDEVRAACEAAYALEFVSRLPQGLATELGERGVRLSGGQRQRLSIARALLADRPVLLLDEATSSLDAESERYVQLALERLMRDRTTLIIAHRLATVRTADRIVVLEHGRIVASGSHADLVRQGGLYARLASLQFLDAVDAATADAAAA